MKKVYFSRNAMLKESFSAPTTSMLVHPSDAPSTPRIGNDVRVERIRAAKLSSRDGDSAAHGRRRHHRRAGRNTRRRTWPRSSCCCCGATPHTPEERAQQGWARTLQPQACAPMPSQSPAPAHALIMPAARSSPPPFICSSCSDAMLVVVAAAAAAGGGIFPVAGPPREVFSGTFFGIALRSCTACGQWRRIIVDAPPAAAFGAGRECWRPSLSAALIAWSS